MKIGSGQRWTACLIACLLSVTGLCYLREYGGSREWAGHVKSFFFTQETLDPPPSTPPYGAVVAAGSSASNLSWMSQIERSWTTFLYNVNVTNTPDPRLKMPKNKGHEAMVYLSYIIANYEELPWMTIFVHGHAESWHQEAHITQLISSLNRTALSREGYISLRCDWYPTCPAEIRPYDHDVTVWGPGIRRKETELAIAGNWRLIFPGEKMPETISSQCCAQFAVTRAAIRTRPKTDYERMREWLLASLLEDEVSGRVFEKLWAYIFTGDAVQ